MNVAISTLARRGHLLAAFAVAVLLAASSGTAWAQNVGFGITASSSTLQEGADNTASTPAPVTVTITRTGSEVYDPTPDDNNSGDEQTPIFSASTGPHLSIRAEYNGRPIAVGNGVDSFDVALKDGSSGSITGELDAAGGSATLNFTDGTDTGTEADRQIQLTLSDVSDNGDWDEEKLVLTLTPGSGLPSAVRVSSSPKLTVTITDDERLPTLKFTPPGIQLAKGNTQTMKVGVGVGAGGRGSLPTGTPSIRATLATLDGEGTERGGSRDEILLSVSPPEAVGTLIQIWKDENTDGVMQPNESIDPDGQNMYGIGTIGVNTTAGAAHGAVAATAGSDDDIALKITAIDVSGFRDEQITFTVMEGRTEAQKNGDGGGIDDADPATVTILSAEETPTVTFSTEAIDIDEGESTTVHLLADTDQGSEVGSATVRVSGDALISLSQGGSSISGGTVSFGGSANAELTITALMDRELEDGEEKTATVTITDASGASIGDPRALTVTVVGATAVPALPLIGQLLLALFLMAGGARLYRRRQK